MRGAESEVFSSLFNKFSYFPCLSNHPAVIITSPPNLPSVCLSSASRFLFFFANMESAEVQKKIVQYGTNATSSSVRIVQKSKGKTSTWTILLVAAQVSLLCAQFC